MGDLMRKNGDELSTPIPAVELPDKENNAFFDLTGDNMADVLVLKMLADMGEYLNLLDLLSAVDPNSTYVLDLAGSLLQGKGGLDALQKLGSGEVLGSLSELVGGDRVFRRSLTASGNLPAQASVQELNLSLQHLATQQQMAAFAAELAEQHEAITRIEQGQKEDRFGEVRGAKEMLYMASRCEDPETQKRLSLSAVERLSVATGKLQTALASRIEGFEPVPSSTGKLVFHMLTSPENYANKKDREYNEIKEYADFLRTADRLKAAAYRMAGEPALADEVYRLQEQFWDSLDFTRLRTIQNMHRQVDFSNEWSFNPRYTLTQDKALLLEAETARYDRVSLALTGEQLLEVLQHDQNGRPEQPGK